MVKGVSKTVIVVNNTGSKLFEKIVFYVTPEYGTLSAKQLKKAARSSSFHYDDSCRPKTVRNRIKRKRQIRLLTAAVITVIIGAVVLAIIL